MWDRTRNLKKKKKPAGGFFRPSLHLKRVNASVTLPPITPGGVTVTIPGRVVLNDITQQGLLIFTPVSLPHGQAVIVNIPEPHPFSMKGNVATCQQMVTDRRIISAEVYGFRIAVEFKFITTEDQEVVKHYFERVQKSYLSRS